MYKTYFTRYITSYALDLHHWSYQRNDLWYIHLMLLYRFHPFNEHTCRSNQNRYYLVNVILIKSENLPAIIAIIRGDFIFNETWLHFKNARALLEHFFWIFIWFLVIYFYYFEIIVLKCLNPVYLLFRAFFFSEVMGFSGQWTEWCRFPITQGIIMFPLALKVAYSLSYR